MPLVCCDTRQTEVLWAKRTLVVGPIEPVDGDSVASTKALLNHLRARGLEAYTLPTITMYDQLKWILTPEDLHPACLPLASAELTCSDLQAAYDAVIAVWQPEQIIVIDGQADRIGFDPRGTDVFTIDHHLVSGCHDDAHAYVQLAPSAGCLLIDHYGVFDPILAVSILTDTFGLRRNQPARAAAYLAILTKHGLTDELLVQMQGQLEERKEAHVLMALRDADMRLVDRCLFVVLKDESPQMHRLATGELESYDVDYLCVVRADGYASLRTRNSAFDLRPFATANGGGGHRAMAVAKLGDLTAEVLEDFYLAFIAAVANHGEPNIPACKAIR